MENTRTSDKSRKMPELPCPHCGHHIKISIDQMLKAKVIFCPVCGTSFNIDKHKSDKALEILKKIDEDSNKVNNQ